MKKLLLISLFLAGCTKGVVDNFGTINKGEVCVKRQINLLVKVTYKPINAPVSVVVAQSSGILEITTSKSKSKTVKFFTLDGIDDIIQLSWHGRYFGKLPSVGKKICVRF